MSATANSLLGLTPANFSSRVKGMSNENYKKVLNSVNQESKRQALLRRFGNTANTTLRNRKNKLLKIDRQIENAERRLRSTRRVAPTPLTASPPQAIAASPPQPLGRGTPGDRASNNQVRRERMEARPPMPPSVPSVPRKTQITTFANLAEREGKKIFVNVSYVPENGVRNFTNKLEGMSSVEKKGCPVLVKQDPSKGYVLSVKTGDSTSLVVPMPVPEVVGGKIVTVPKSVAQPILDEEKEPKKISIQHSFLKENKGVYSISYEANLYKDQKSKPFFYYLNVQELKENGNDGIPMYDVPGVPGEFLLNQ